MHTSWHDFIQMHSGKGHTMSELSKLYKKKSAGRTMQGEWECTKKAPSRASGQKKRTTQKKTTQKKRMSQRGGPCRDASTGRYESCSM